MSKKERSQQNDFYEAVYALVKLVPPGRVTTYGALAKALGTASAARMVGYAMNACLHREDVPAHRVVNRQGLLTGKHHFPEAHSMQARLEAEGISVQQDQVMHFDQLFWDPMKEMNM